MQRRAKLETNHQRGMTLIEVLIATLILSVGLLGVAATQISALKYTDSARMSTQASFIAYDMLDRMRANSTGDYHLAELSDISPRTVASEVVGQDLSEFKRNIRLFAGETAQGFIAVSGQQVTITVQWDDSRAERGDGVFQTFTLNSHIQPYSTVVNR